MRLKKDPLALHGNAKSLTWTMEGECIRCTSHLLNETGYPVMMRARKFGTIARHIVRRRHGRIGWEVVARHTCDNRWCIRPDHIIIGSRADNNHDKISRGRAVYVHGEASGGSKLKESDVLAIRASIETQRPLAKKYGVDQTTIGSIKRRETWNYLP